MTEATQSATHPDPNDVQTEKEVARDLRVSVEKVRRMRYAVPPRGPRFFRIDRSVRYRRRDVLDFADLVARRNQAAAPRRRTDPHVPEANQPHAQAERRPPCRLKEALHREK
ncbi:MAG: hypothetical protein IPP07_00515 [Holophagales bacterium]|nr:hypothetical protein [Holophagales bacterium]